MISTRRHVLRLLLALVCALLVAPRAYANQPTSVGDFDGDGHGDRVTFTLQEPSIVRVWLSATRTTQIIRSPEPLLAVVVHDLDGDRRAELVATKRSSGLHIWTKKQKGFRAYRPTHRPSPVALSRSNHRAFDPGPTPPVLETTAFSSVPPTLVISSVHPRAPAFRAWRYAPRLARDPTSSPRLTPFAPRPPPPSAL
jgi:hypothetical protein